MNKHQNTLSIFKLGNTVCDTHGKILHADGLMFESKPQRTKFVKTNPMVKHFATGLNITGFRR